MNILFIYIFIFIDYLAKQEVEIQARENVIRDKINARKQAEKDASYHGMYLLE